MRGEGGNRRRTEMRRINKIFDEVVYACASSVGAGGSWFSCFAMFDLHGSAPGSSYKCGIQMSLKHAHKESNSCQDERINGMVFCLSQHGYCKFQDSYIFSTTVTKTIDHNPPFATPTMAFRCIVLTLVMALCLEVAPVYSQITTPCSPAMITSFTPCLNFITNSTTNGTSTPTSDCCNSLKSLTSRGTDCLCLIVTGSVPFQIPVNRTLAISLPRACRMPGVPLQCKAPAAAPIPPPEMLIVDIEIIGPAALGPDPSPGSSSTIPETLSPNTTPESNITPRLAPESDTTPTLTPPSTGVSSGVPTTNSGSRPTLTPSVASTYSNSQSVLATSGVMCILYFLI
ncbi:hypothetical protein L1987_74397 [Smallanthus sonchifolius]|uniref:Uncharacterized protein n=1 Tax=Smallanthus sonchifolius TaxID=185202 RepID=A0ACB9A1U8_9ASTR|nr:hypothetical protein L1987_74397 [Smallanthus sonchifolius]